MTPPKPFPRTRRAFLRAAWQAGATSLFAVPATTGALRRPATEQAARMSSVAPGVAGRVVDVATLAPVAGASVRADPLGIETTSDASGSYTLPLPTGVYTLAVTAPGYVGTSRLNQIVGEGVTSLDLDLIPASPSESQQALLYQRLVKQFAAPLVTPGALGHPSLRLATVGLPATITVYYDTANPPYSVAVPLEDYVKGVVPNEVPASWPAATLQAQAVAARSYGVASQLSHGYVYPDTRSQVYDPTYRTQATDAAVDATAGQVLTVDGSVIFAFFYSRCNGITTVNSEEAIAYQTDSNGQIIYNAQGQAICITDGWSYLSYCRARPCTGHSPSSYSTCGYYGHGVGMCQWGAYYRGNLAYTDILTSYYTGVSIDGASPAPTPTPTPVPPPPTPRPLTPGLATPSQPITLAWTSVGPGVSYLVTLFQGSQQLKGTTTSATAWSIGTLPLGTYTWTVQASSSAGTSGVLSTTLIVVPRLYQTYLPWLTSE